jgi:Protein of unknown function (DUF2795)
MMSFQRAAELQGLLEGVPLPATRRALLHYAAQQPGGESFRPELERLPERKYGSLDEVGEALVSVQPERLRGAREPRAESGPPPGGEAYTDASAEPGSVRERGPGG